MYKLDIKSGQGKYQALIIDKVEETVSRLLSISNSMVIIDKNVSELYKDQLTELVSTRPTLVIEATEETKTLDGIFSTVTWLQEQGATKQTVVIAIGGGIIQDICAFSSHIYYRGIKWVLVTTTLLSMGDSCIGAKCGINLNAFKNQVGVFHSPSEVLICPEFTNTLTDEDLMSGYGEIFRLMLTKSYKHFDKFATVISEKGMRNDDLGELIYISLKVKKTIIEKDEYETGLRRVLNYGHTFGHALEAVTDHEVPHGLGVAWGLDLINFMAVERGLLSKEKFETIHNFIRKQFPFEIHSPVDAEGLIKAAKKDKKVKDGQAVLVLPSDYGKFDFYKTPFDDKMNSVITNYLESYNVFHRN